MTFLGGYHMKTYRVKVGDTGMATILEAKSARDAKKQAKKQFGWLFKIYGKHPKLIAMEV